MKNSANHTFSLPAPARWASFYLKVIRNRYLHISKSPTHHQTKMKQSILCLAILAMPMLSPAAVTVYTATLSGPAEAPPNASPGTGFATLTIDSSLSTMRLQASFVGLIGNVTAAHIHSATSIPGTGTAGVATTTPTFPGFPSGVTAGSYDFTFDMTQPSSYNPTFVTNNGGTPASAFLALQNGLNTGRAYLNIHTSTFTGGEIRGFLVPEPGSAGLAALAGAGLLIRRRRPGVG
jgi:hypothetical protein